MSAHVAAYERGESGGLEEERKGGNYEGLGGWWEGRKVV